MNVQQITPAQTIGPFYGFALPYEGGPVVARDGDVRVHGSVFDGAGALVSDALVEVFQADPDGALDGGLFGRCSTRPEGSFAFTTVKPGPTADGCAPHLAVIVHARGLLLHLHTRMYFPEEAQAHAADPVLAAVPKQRRHTLIAEPDEGGLRFDIRLQGGDETVFFDV
ncbi:MAG TPA: protocatechuate 3,4-dioxygenase subunit alpha [Glycomyces sp.]|nr:protocatechuate 3,4-dioxygenase subunit alpha [Glycomyces sp.]